MYQSIFWYFTVKFLSFYLKVDSILGYNPRYWPWKSKIDRVHGAFTTTLKDWVAPIDDNYLFKWFNSKNGKAASVSWPFFKVNPNTLDSIFAVAADSIVTGKQIGRAHV